MRDDLKLSPVLLTTSRLYFGYRSSVTFRGRQG